MAAGLIGDMYLGYIPHFFYIVPKFFFCQAVGQIYGIGNKAVHIPHNVFHPLRR